MTDAGYADDLEFSTNTPAKAESLLHNLEQSAGSICLYVSGNKTVHVF